MSHALINVWSSFHQQNRTRKSTLTQRPGPRKTKRYRIFIHARQTKASTGHPQHLFSPSHMPYFAHIVNVKLARVGEHIKTRIHSYVRVSACTCLLTTLSLPVAVARGFAHLCARSAHESQHSCPYTVLHLLVCVEGCRNQ